MRLPCVGSESTGQISRRFRESTDGVPSDFNCGSSESAEDLSRFAPPKILNTSATVITDGTDCYGTRAMRDSRGLKKRHRGSSIPGISFPPRKAATCRKRYCPAVFFLPITAGATVNASTRGAVMGLDVAGVTGSHSTVGSLGGIAADGEGSETSVDGRNCFARRYTAKPVRHSTSLKTFMIRRTTRTPHKPNRWNSDMTAETPATFKYNDALLAVSGASCLLRCAAFRLMGRSNDREEPIDLWLLDVEAASTPRADPFAIGVKMRPFVPRRT